MAAELASQEENRQNRIPLGCVRACEQASERASAGNPSAPLTCIGSAHRWRDNCSALLISLNKCRHATLYAPWKCEDERHTYEKWVPIVGVSYARFVQVRNRQR